MIGKANSLERGMIRRAATRFPIVAYYFLAVLVVVLVVAYWQVAAVIYENVQGRPLDLFALVEGAAARLGHEYLNLVASIHIIFYYPLVAPAICFGLAPTISALIVQSLRSGRGGVATLLRRLRPYGDSAAAREIWICYGTIVISAAALCGVFIVVQSYTADAEAVQRSYQILGWPSATAVVGAFALGAFLDEGGLLEELGWRGFALPLLLDRFNPLLASVAVGLLWSSWHLPREFALLAGGDSTFFYFLLKQIDFFISGVAVSIVITRFFVLSGGSVVPAIMIHGLANFFSKTFLHDGMPVWFVSIRFQTAVEAALAIAIIVFVGRNLGMKRDGDATSWSGVIDAR